MGCYLNIALLQSDLRCFHDDLCLQKLKSSLNLSSNSAPLLNVSSIYHVETTLLKILSNLMVEQWNEQIFYENYFRRCHPKECTITYVVRGNIPYIITTMTGMIGGLTKVYMYGTPLLITIILALVERWKQTKLTQNRVTPLATTATSTNILVCEKTTD